MVEHLNPELVVSALRLLMEGYKLARDKFKDKKTPDRVEEIVIRAEKSQPRLNQAELERSITEALDPSDAEIVKGDLELLSLLVLPAPALDVFDYWGKLTLLVSGLQAYATSHRFFELRGTKDGVLGEVILLPRCGSCILPEKIASGMVTVYKAQKVKDASSLAYLRKAPVGFPIVLLVEARLDDYSYVPPTVVTHSAYFHVKRGQERYWLRFENHENFGTGFRTTSEYKLAASDLISIVAALRDDIRQYAEEVHAHEQKIAPLFTQIDAFVEKMKT